MPRYFFDIEGSWTLGNTEGVELANLEAAKVEAARMVGQIVKDHAEVLSGWPWTFTVRNGSGDTVYELQVREHLA